MASIDITTTGLLLKMLRKELIGATIVIIAHRMDEELLKSVDYKILLENGKVIK